MRWEWSVELHQSGKHMGLSQENDHVGILTGKSLAKFYQFAATWRIFSRAKITRYPTWARLTPVAAAGLRKCAELGCRGRAGL